MKITFSKKQVNNEHISSPIRPGHVYKIIGINGGLYESTDAVGFRAFRDSVTYFYKDGSCGTCSHDHARASFNFEEFHGTITIECP